MRPEDSKHTQKSSELVDLPKLTSADASKDADKVKGGAEIVSPRDPASGLPTGKRQH